MKRILSTALAVLLSTTAFAHSERADQWIQIEAKNKFDRSKLTDLGISIEATRSDSVWGFATQEEIAAAKKLGFKILGSFDTKVARGGHEGSFDFPSQDSRFHNYAETLSEIARLVKENPELAMAHTIGKSHEGKDLVILHINSDPVSRARGISNKPGIIYMGNHHAREHLSLEVPLILADYLLKNKTNPTIAKLLSTRDIWILPMVNPDGAEFDTADGKYHMWRKNRKINGDGTFGVDLNRNYGFKWGSGGSSTSTSSDVYMGPKPFSEPETQAVKSFIDGRPNLRVLLSFHTYSELILYPWGHKYDSVETAKDLKVFETMAQTMSKWNGYKPQQASDLYIASGDTTDWAYGEHGIFAFTFELSPKNSFGGGGFYPGQGVIDRVFEANLRPCLYMMDLADDPYRALNGGQRQWLKNYREPIVNTQEWLN